MTDPTAQTPGSKPSLLTQIIIYELPFSLFLLYFMFYNFGVANAIEMTKTFGLVSITLLAITLLVGPLSNYFPYFAKFKSGGKFWGISIVLCVLIHLAIVYKYRYNLDLALMFDPKAHVFWGIIFGFVSFAFLLYKLIKPIKKSAKSIPNSIWKNILTVTYLALIFGFVHFYIVESNANNVLVIKRLMGQIAFAFAGLTIIVRFILHIISYKKQKV